jgi:catalase
MAQSEPQQLVDALYAVFGDNHSRAVHAKGVLLAGDFTPRSEARELCKVPLFAGPRVPLTARFSNFTGIPTIPDTIPEASPRGLALKLEVRGQAAVEIVAHAFDGFPVKIAAGAIRLRAQAADQAKANRESSFSPGFLEDGIAAADPMIDVRHAAYRSSVEHRR